MNWSMPRPVLHLVAVLLGAACVSSFMFMAFTASPPGRLPGEAGPGGNAPVIEAVDAQPLTLERIEGAPPPKELTEEEKARLEAEALAKSEAAALAKAEAEKAVVAVAPTMQVPTPAQPVAPPPPAAKAPQREEPVF